MISSFMTVKITSLGISCLSGNGPQFHGLSAFSRVRKK
jgi:hypothetical protein